MNDMNYIRLLEENYQQLKNSKLLYGDKRLRYLSAQLYTDAQQRIDINQFSTLVKTFKEVLPTFNALDSTARLPLISYMAVKGLDSRDDVFDVIALYNRLIEVGYRRNGFTYLAAALVLNVPPSQREAVILRGIEIYRIFRKQHPWLTSYEDIPNTILLAQMSDLSVAEMTDVTEAYYLAFTSLGFTKSNELQFLSAISTYLTGEINEGYIARCQEVWEAFKAANIKVKRGNYLEISVLALSNQPVEDLIADTQDFYKHLNQVAKLSWQPRTALSLTMNYVGCKHLAGAVDPEVLSTLRILLTMLEISTEMAVIIASSNG